MEKTPEIEKRLMRLEFVSEELSNDLSELKGEYKDMDTRLRDMQKNINQVKWIVLGAVLYALIQEMGLLEAIKIIF